VSKPPEPTEERAFTPAIRNDRGRCPICDSPGEEGSKCGVCVGWVRTLKGR